MRPTGRLRAGTRGWAVHARFDSLLSWCLPIRVSHLVGVLLLQRNGATQRSPFGLQKAGQKAGQQRLNVNGRYDMAGCPHGADLRPGAFLRNVQAATPEVGPAPLRYLRRLPELPDPSRWVQQAHSRAKLRANARLPFGLSLSA